MTKNEEHDPQLIQQAIKTNFPSPLSRKDNGMSKDEKIDYIAERFYDIMYALGLDMDDESLQRTPLRVAKMYVEEIFSGIDPTSFPDIRFVENEYHHSNDGNMVFVKINMNSFCEHHFVPVIGTAYVAYIPNKKLIGLSKIPRIVKFFSQRPQLQERLCAQVADCLSTLLETPSVAVSVTAQHYCMIARGIEDFTSHTTTNVFRGDFETNPETRRQFFESINRNLLS
ncbi:MAG: GTP cyclohydrolase I FolE [Chlamydiota bacterium]|nr:GTP cyclohydrolase I FolE [Chlamydiota bacterium]